MEVIGRRLALAASPVKARLAWVAWRLLWGLIGAMIAWWLTGGYYAGVGFVTGWLGSWWAMRRIIRNSQENHANVIR